MFYDFEELVHPHHTYVVIEAQMNKVNTHSDVKAYGRWIKINK